MDILFDSLSGALDAETLDVAVRIAGAVAFGGNAARARVGIDLLCKFVQCGAAPPACLDSLLKVSLFTVTVCANPANDLTCPPHILSF